MINNEIELSDITNSNIYLLPEDIKILNEENIDLDEKLINIIKTYCVKNNISSPLP